MRPTRRFLPPWPGPKRKVEASPSPLSMAVLAIIALVIYETIRGMASMATPGSLLSSKGRKGHGMRAEGMSALWPSPLGADQGYYHGLDPCLSLEDIRRAHAPQHHIFIAVPLHYSNDGVPELLRSLAMQEYPRLTVVFYDDAATDGSGELLAKAEARDPLMFELVVLSGVERLGPAHARWQLIRYILGRADPMDIVMFVDGDDRLFHAGVLRELDEAFRARKPWVAYGRMRGPYEEDCGPPSLPIVYPAPGTNISSSVRSEWRYCHPRVYRAFILRHYEEADFRDPDPATNPSGRWLQKCTDCQLVFKGLELAGDRHVAFLDGPLPHIYYRVSETATTFQIAQDVKQRDNTYAYSRHAPAALLESIHVVMCLQPSLPAGSNVSALLQEALVANVDAQDVGARPLYMHIAVPSTLMDAESAERALGSIMNDSNSYRLRTFAPSAAGCDVARLEMMRDAVRIFPAVDFFVTMDSDIALPPGGGLAELLASYARPRECNAWWGQKFQSLGGYGQSRVSEEDIREGRRPGIADWHYASMRLAVLDADLVRFHSSFLLDRLPEQYHLAADLYLSYVAYMLGWRLRRIMLPGIQATTEAREEKKSHHSKGENEAGSNASIIDNGSEDVRVQLYHKLRRGCGWYT